MCPKTTSKLNRAGRKGFLDPRCEEMGILYANFHRDDGKLEGGIQRMTRK